MLQRDALTGRPRIVAPARARRLGPRPDGCPFCPGNEEQTPPELDRIVAGEEVGAARPWAARAVPNLFPLAEHHEVLVMTPRHVTTSRDMSAKEWGVALELWQRRLDVHHRVGGDGMYAHLFVNDGRGAGASLEHSHAQLVVVEDVPAIRDLRRAVTHPDDCAACRIVRAGPRELVVWAGGGVEVRAHETPTAGDGLIVLPTAHDRTIVETGLGAVGEAMHAAVHALPAADFNLWLVEDPVEAGHWYVELMPRSAMLAGVEVGVGIGVVTTDPAQAARDARERLASA